MPPPPIPTTFARKKAKILQDLSVPDGEYSDRSPKGSVDEGIRELIDEINAHKGFVTTSSCAGRISVFQEGNGRAIDSENEGREVETSLVVGGKGGGKFLFVSHEPVSISEAGGLQQLPELFCLDEVLIAGGDIASVSRLSGRRYVRFAFEPMVRRRQFERKN
jgi:tRNA wybutosine-synthesizing protein 3